MSEFRSNNFQFKRDTTKTLNHCRGRSSLRLPQRKCTFGQALFFPLASSIRSDREDSAGKIVRAPQVGMSEFRSNNFQFKRDTTKTINHCRGAHCCVFPNENVLSASFIFPACQLDQI